MTKVWVFLQISLILFYHFLNRAELVAFFTRRLHPDNQPVKLTLNIEERLLQSRLVVAQNRFRPSLFASGLGFDLLQRQRKAGIHLVVEVTEKTCHAGFLVRVDRPALEDGVSDLILEPFIFIVVVHGLREITVKHIYIIVSHSITAIPGKSLIYI